MLSDKELADAVVALDIGLLPEDGLYQILFADTSDLYTAEMIVRDWRVAGALMEKVWGCNVIRKGDEWEAHVVTVGQIREYIARNESPVRAIVEACVKALS